MPELLPPAVPLSVAGDVIVACWVIFMLVWLVSARFVKPTAERSGANRRLVTLVIPFYGAFLLFWSEPPGWLGLLLVPHTATAFDLAMILALAGLAVSLWARFTLAGNWSGDVTLKEGHELVSRGPYRYVRHPIYTGVLLLFLGTAICIGRLTGFVAFVLMLVGFWVKLKQEEALLTRHFPAAYPAYKARVKALIPFVI
jgi:protein-S-isoprenylcysteine O-methyltransferase Ste14